MKYLTKCLKNGGLCSDAQQMPEKKKKNYICVEKVWRNTIMKVNQKGT